MKKLDSSIIAALILVAGMLVTVGIYIWFSPLQTCIRASDDSNRKRAAYFCAQDMGGR